MDSYTVILCTDTPGGFQLDLLLRELRAADAQTDFAVGAAFVALVRPVSSSGGAAAAAGAKAPQWRRLKDELTADELETAGATTDACDALDALADRLPDADVMASVVWLCGTRMPVPERGPLFAALLRWRLWHGAVCQLWSAVRFGAASAGAAAAAAPLVASWRRLLDADGTAVLRPTLRLRLRLPAGSPSAVVSLQAHCDAKAWERLRTAASAAHGGDESITLAVLDGVEVAAEIAADSVPANTLSDCRLRIRRLGFAAEQAHCAWGGGRTALLVRLLTAPAGDGERRWDTEDWKRMAADGRPPDRRAPPPGARPLHFIVTAEADGDDNVGLMTLLASDAAEKLAVLPPRPPELSLSELRALAGAFGDWAAAAELLSRLSGAAEEPSGWPERRGLAHWQEVQRRAAPASTRPATDSLVLDADGILGALADLKMPPTDPGAADASPRKLAAVPWPDAADRPAPGVFYNTSEAAEERELRSARLRERCVAAETACTCSVWRSDAVSVSKAKAPAPAAARARSSPRRRPAPVGSSSGGSARHGKQHPSAPRSSATPSVARSTAPSARPDHSEFKTRLTKAVRAALAEHGVGSREAEFRSCARKLGAIVQAYLQDVKGAGDTSARQLLKLARVHVGHVIKVQRELQAAA